MCQTWPYKVMAGVLLLEGQLCKGQIPDVEVQEQGPQGRSSRLEHQRSSGSTCAPGEKSRDYTSTHHQGPSCWFSSVCDWCVLTAKYAFLCPHEGFLLCLPNFPYPKVKFLRYCQTSFFPSKWKLFGWYRFPLAPKDKAYFSSNKHGDAGKTTLKTN